MLIYFLTPLTPNFFTFVVFVFPFPKVDLCTLVYHTQSKRASPPLTSLKDKEMMGDHHNIVDKEGTSSEGDSVAGQNEMILKIEQRILELQGELAKLSLNLNTPELQADNYAISNFRKRPNPVLNNQNIPTPIYTPTQDPKTPLTHLPKNLRTKIYITITHPTVTI